MSFLIPSSIPARPPSLIGRVEEWKGPQGLAWARRNPPTVETLDANYVGRFGVTRTEVNLDMLESVPRNVSVLEVGCSAGRQLDALAEIGFTDLQGCDLSADALNESKWPGVVADGTKLPFPDKSFDLVMTSGTLMQIPFPHKGQFIAEMLRVSRRWIYGCEMWSPEPKCFDFGDLMPPAWTCDWFALMETLKWPMVKRRLLDAKANNYPLAFYLLERPT